MEAVKLTREVGEKRVKKNKSDRKRKRDKDSYASATGIAIDNKANLHGRHSSVPQGLGTVRHHTYQQLPLQYVRLIVGDL